MRKSLAVLGALALPLAFPAAALAQSDSTTYVADLGELNGSGASGTATVTLSGDQLTVEIEADGLVAGQPHAQHFHYPEGGSATCPDSSADENGNGLISTPEGVPFYGGIVASLTTEGDAGPDSGLAVERFPTAPGGSESYSRTFTVPEGFDAAEDLGDTAVVVHGIDANGNGEYDFDAAGESELDPNLPAEATHPALCGALSPAADGGVASGLGGTNGVQDTALIFAGLGSLAAAGGVVAYSRRRGQQA
ncbi:MAG TPA: hypothetical protein VJ976_10375 [Ornithinimicrobium sp.]|uniref:hypothetical protein n=1 Tax=Ornithinimicrobium sp. TaxID=1977084 RepID=UPI002B489239|nr:hypothetical protein [Ornithinimicrobium sp.]HKJ12776.1 hypothetical protein [Ornithinimicrobium sp.]